MQKAYGLTECHYDYTKENPVVEEDAIIKTIFAPNPFTGFADNSLELQLSRKTDRAITEFLESFNKPLPALTGAPDDDSALEMVAPTSSLSPEVIESYYQTLSDIASEKSVDEKGVE